MFLTDCNCRAKWERDAKLATHSETGPHYQWRVTPTSGNVHLQH